MSGIVLGIKDIKIDKTWSLPFRNSESNGRQTYSHIITKYFQKPATYQLNYRSLVYHPIVSPLDYYNSLLSALSASTLASLTSKSLFSTVTRMILFSVSQIMSLLQMLQWLPFHTEQNQSLYKGLQDPKLSCHVADLISHCPPPCSLH